MASSNINEYQTARVETDDIGQVVDELKNVAEGNRRSFERRWYDNKFFDDGYHFRFLQRSTNKIIDLSERTNIYNPTRAIPKASRQIRGVANLLMSNDPTPIVYPEKVSILQNPDEAKRIAKLVTIPATSPLSR